jgi:hypothetical protein
MTVDPLLDLLRADEAAQDTSVWPRPHVPSADPALSVDWQVQRASHPNVLVVGPDVDVVNALRTLPRVWRQPVVTHRPPDPLVLPTPFHAGTVVLREVSCLSLNDQHRLMAWLEGDCGRTQIIATDTRPVWPRLQTGAFLASLYYRLNIIYIDLTPIGHGRVDVLDLGFQRGAIDGDGGHSQSHLI